MWKRSGRSAALERAQAALSSRSRAAAPAASAPRGGSQTDRAKFSPKLRLSDLSDSESSLSAMGRTEPRVSTEPNPRSDTALEVARPLSPTDSDVVRFLKRPSAAAQEQPKNRAVPSSLRASQTAALSRLAQIENRFGKSVYTRSPSKAEQTTVTEESISSTSTARPSTARPSTARPSTARPSTARPSTEEPNKTQLSVVGTIVVQPRGFVKSRPVVAQGRDCDSPEHSTVQESNSRGQHPQKTTPLQPQFRFSPPGRSPSPLTSSPFPSMGSVSYACGEVRPLQAVMSLEDASEEPHCDEEPHSDCSDGSDFKVKLMDLDELGPALLLEEPLSAQESELQEAEEVEEEVKEEEEEDKYLSDFESFAQTESVSEHSRDHGPPQSAQSRSSPSDAVTGAMFDPSSPEAPLHSPLPRDHPPPPFHRAYQLHTSSGKASTDGQGPSLPVLVCSSCPSLELLMQSLRQQLALTSLSHRRAQEQRAQALEALGPPNYRYTTLQDTLKHISSLHASSPHSEQQAETT